jgi:hypothetical protein
MQVDGLCETNNVSKRFSLVLLFMTRISNDGLRIFYDLPVGEDAIVDDYQDNLPGIFLLAAALRKLSGQNMSLVTELERLANTLDEAVEDAPPVAWSSVAERIAKNLSVKTDEVGILGLSAKWRHLHFLAPEALKNVGFIPLTSNSALAARTARENRPEIDNNFSAARHATVFEGVKTGAGDPGDAIQKIISAPILAGGKVIGVIQISRKGSSTVTAGPDFTQADLGKVLALSKPLGKLLRHVATE